MARTTQKPPEGKPQQADAKPKPTPKTVIVSRQVFSDFAAI